MMNKLVSGAAIGMVTLGSLGLGAAAFADSTAVEYDVDSTYTLIIPQKVELNSDSVTNMSIKTKDRNLEPGDTIAVSITSGLEADGEIKLERKGSTSDSLTSSVQVDGVDVSLANPVVGEFSGYALEETEVSSIEFGIPQGNKLAGGYAQTLVFTASQK